MTTIAAALSAARQQTAVNEARLLLRHVLGCSAVHLEAHREDDLATDIEEKFHALVERRCQGEPIAYLTGTREFYGREFHVAPSVLIPRPETELIVDTVLGKFSGGRKLRILDLGTGSGCLAITLALEFTQAVVTALDISLDALAIARQNAVELAAEVRFLQSDWFSLMANEHFDLIVSNPPYISQDDPHLAQGDLRFEPQRALASGADGLEAIHAIVSTARTHLNTGGLLLLEHGYDQADRVDGLLAEFGFIGIERYRDLAGTIRVSGGCVG